jgi:DNA polymerase-3 subunit gamma/tau
VSAEPCGECAACRAIDEGRFVDLIEVDAASRTKVDDTRELLDNVQYMPTRGRFKVYLIDEVHMLTTHSFNALLKTLEEPPPHVKFLLATTDPQKLPVTVLSRCLQFNLKKIAPRAIQEQLAKIAGSEGIPAEDDGLKAIARSAGGSLRDALSLLDQAIAFGGGAIRGDDVRQMLGSIDRDQVARILAALADRDGTAMLAEVDRLDEQGCDYASVLDEILSALQRAAILQLVEGRARNDEDEAWRELADALDPEDIQLYYQIALAGRRDIAVCRDERMSFEMTLLRMLAFRPDAVPGVKGAAPSATANPQGGARAPQVSAAPSAPRPKPAVGPGSGGMPPAESRRGTVQGISAVRPIPPWGELVKSAGLRGAVGNLADHCEIAAVSGDRLELVLVRDKANFNTEQLRQRLEDALSRHLGRRIVLSITPGDPPRATPAENRRAGEDARMRHTREAIESDPNIQAVQAAFDAILEPDSIQPAQPKI